MDETKRETLNYPHHQANQGGNLNFTNSFTLSDIFLVQNASSKYHFNDIEEIDLK